MPPLEIRYLLRIRKTLERRSRELAHSRLVYRGIPYSSVVQ